MTTILTRTIARLLFLPIMMTALAVLVKGYVSPGDGFSGGVIAAMGVLLQYVAFGYREAEAALPVRYSQTLVAIGLAILLLVIFAPAVAGWPILTHFPLPGDAVTKVGSVEIITAFLFDVGVFLIVVGFSMGAIGGIAHILEGREA